MMVNEPQKNRKNTQTQKTETMRNLRRNQTPKNIVNDGQIQIITSEGIGNVCPKKIGIVLLRKKTSPFHRHKNLTIVQV